MPDYQVVLDAFRGPLDLLLYLVKREEVDVRDIPVARVAEQFKEYLDVLTLIDVERAGDFLVTAATLMEIKSKMLLPHAEETAEAEEDPRRQLVQQLIQYKRFKDAAGLLESQAERHGLRLARQPAAAGPSNSPQRLEPVELWDLVSAFGRLMRETMAQQTHDVVVDQTPLHVYMTMILDRLREQTPLPFAALFTPPYTRGRLVGLFLGVLELTKQRRIIPEQGDAFTEIWVSLAAEAAPPTPATLPAPAP
ncbi:MAG TPA: segregation/condensation protein A [Gemmataceae bacterium]|nr:segregation/condensation protein A [Gemmataceae bacterium]